MSIRLMPLQSYDEHEVIEGRFRSEVVNADFTTSGDGDNGVFVKVTAGDLNLGPLEYGSQTHLGKVNYPYAGRNYVPQVPNTVGAADQASRAIGITLKQTALADENGEKLYYNPQKADSNGAILSGHAVPVLVRGRAQITQAAFEGNVVPAPGSDLVISATDGKVSGIAFGLASTGALANLQVVGTVLLTGSRVAGAGTPYTDVYVGANGVTGGFAEVFINCI